MTVEQTCVGGVVYHFSEDPTIKRFTPHVPHSDPGHPPAVWAIDAEHAPLYWFPRDCPRISVWAYTPEQQELLTAAFASEASRIVATEMRCLPSIRSTVLYRYAFDAAEFRPGSLADGQYVSDHVVAPLSVEPLEDLLSQYVAADVELRFTPRLGALTDAMLASGLPFSFVRIRNATV